jgi:hypothetical protein
MSLIDYSNTGLKKQILSFGISPDLNCKNAAGIDTKSVLQVTVVT